MIRCTAATMGLLLALGLSAAAKAEVTKIEFGTTSRTIFVLPVWLALDRGYLRDEGLDVNVVVADSVDREKEMLKSGALQIAISAPDAVIADAERGEMAIVMIGGNAERLPHVIIAHPRIKRLADLKGATVGVAGASDGTTSLMPDIARAGGFEASDLNLKVVGGAPTRWKLLQEGTIDAGLQPIPQSYLAEAAGFSNLGALVDIVPEYQFTAFAVERGWASRNASTVAAFLRAVRRGSDDMFKDPDLATRVAAREMQTTPELARRAIEDAKRMGIFSRDLSVSRPALKRVFDTLRGSGRVPADAVFEWSRYVDESFLAAAAARIVNEQAK